MSKKILVSISSIVIILAAGFFGYAYYTKNSLHSFENELTSSQDSLIESMLPNDVYALLAFNWNNDITKHRTQNIIKLFTKSDTLANDWIKSQFEEDPDLYELVQNTERAVLSAANKLDETSPERLYFVLNANDPEIITKVKTENVQNNKWQIETVENQEILINSEEADFFATQIKDLLIITNTKEEAVRIAKKTYENNSVLQKEDFRDVVKSIDSPSLLYIYAEPSKVITQLLTFLKNEGQLPASEEIMIRSILGQDALNIVKAAGFSVSTEKDGLAFHTYSLGNKELMKQKLFAFDTVPHRSPYLSSKLPKTNTILYAETFDLITSWKQSLSLYDTGTQNQVTGIFDIIKGSLATFSGLNAEKDIAPLFARGFSIALQHDDKSLIPFLSLLIDVNTQVNNTRNLVQALDRGTNFLMNQVEIQTGSNTLVTKDNVDIKGQKLSRLKVNMEELLAMVATFPPHIQTQFENMQLQFVYGVTGDEVLILSTMPNIESRYAQNESLEDETDFKEALGNRKGKLQALQYINTKNLISYIETVFTVIDTLEPLSASEKTSYQKVMDFIKPLGYVVMGVESEEFESHTKAFLKIEGMEME